MKKAILLLSLVTTIIVINLFIATSGCTPKKGSEDGNGVPNSYAQLPLDITVQEQRAADSFSWLTFIAMCWPADSSSCGPDTVNGNILSGSGPLVWETYLSSDEVFVASPGQPEPWCGGLNAKKLGSTRFQKLPSKVQELARKTGVYRFLHRNSKAPHGLDQAVGGPLVDQNGRFARYEVRMNHDEYNYIVQNALWDTAGQRTFAAADTAVLMPGGPSQFGPVGAMELKAAWKVLGKGDDSTKFYTIRAIVYNDDSGEPSPGPNPVTLGLVGLHIARKTATQRNWVWSTFEHVDNLTTSFFNPNCDTCIANVPLPPGTETELDTNGNPLNPPTQVTRVNPVGDIFVGPMNTYFQNMLQGSVWANYQLVSTQWLLFEHAFPKFLANSVQETYVQGPNPPSYGGFPLRIDEEYYTDSLYNPFGPNISASCMGCHYVGTLPYVQTVKSDFSFMLGEAK
jgi:hypothetical protein